MRSNKTVSKIFLEKAATCAFIDETLSLTEKFFDNSYSYFSLPCFAMLC